MNDLADRLSDRLLEFLPGYVGEIVAGYFTLKGIGIVVIALLSWFIFDKRIRKRHGDQVPAGYARTEEVSIDPTNGKTLRVFYNEATGDRFYKEER